jgi:hypothetical protein
MYNHFAKKHCALSGEKVTGSYFLAIKRWMMVKTRISVIIIIVVFLLSFSSNQSLAQPALPTQLDLSSPAHSFSVNAPEPFDKLLPINGAIDQPVSNLTLSWNPSSSPEVTYQYCLRTNSNCPGPKWVSVGANTSVTLSGLSSNTLYYWQVRAVDAQNNYTYANNGSLWSFRTLVNNTLPGAFNKLTPLDAATNQPIVGLKLTWSASSLATSYQYCADTLNNNTCDTSWTSVTGLSASLDGLAYDTTYYWQVNAVNAGGNTQADGGTWFYFQTQLAPPAEFGKAAPANYSVNQPTSLTLSWQESVGIGVTYEYCLAVTACTPYSTWVPAGTNLSADVSGLQFGATYYWQVRAVNPTSKVYADGGSNWVFTTNIAPPTDFGKTSPGNGAIDQTLSLTLTWGTSAGTNVTYEYCYGTATCTPDSIWLLAGTNTSASISGLAYATPYYWQVRAVNSAGATYANANDVTPVWQFTTQSAPPQPFGKLNPPSTNPTDVPLNTTLSWTASAGSTTYQFCWDKVAHQDNDDSCSTDTGSGWVENVTTETGHLSLEPNQVYYWQVKALNDLGSILADNGVWFQFTTIATPPSDFTKLSPLNGALDQSLTPWLYWWSPHNENTTYEYCTYPTGSDCTGRWTAVAENDPIQITPLLDPNTTYFWQLRAYPTGGDPNDATYANNGTEWSFNTIKGPPTCSDQTFSDAVENTLYTAEITNFTSSYTPTFSLFGSPPAGTLLLSGNGSFSYLPVEYYNGTVTYQFLVSDGHNSPAGPCTATIVVNPVNNTPVLSPIPDARVLVGTRLMFWVSATDPDLPYGDVLTYSIDGTLPSGASIDPQTGLFIWDVPALQTGGPYVFTFRVTDSQGQSASQPVKILVYYPNLYMPLIVR